MKGLGKYKEVSKKKVCIQADKRKLITPNEKKAEDRKSPK